MGALIEKLKPLREAAGLTQDQLAKRLGYKNHTPITKAESGKSNPKLPLVERWIEACGADIYLVPKEAMPGADEVRAVLAALDPAQQEALIRMARVLPRMTADRQKEFEGTVRFWEGVFGGARKAG